MTASAKITISYTEITERREKAIRVRLSAQDRNAVWLPLHRVSLDETAQTITASAKLIAEKQADARRDFAAERKAHNDGLIVLQPAAWESDKAIGIDVSVVCPHTDQAVKGRVFFPKSQICGGSAPRWLVAAKEAEIVERLGGNYPARGSLMVEGLRAEG